MGKFKMVAGFLIASNIISTSACLYTYYKSNQNRIILLKTV